MLLQEALNADCAEPKEVALIRMAFTAQKPSLQTRVQT